MSPHVVVDQWARACATRIANETGWRASEIYMFLIMTNADRDREARLAAEQLITRMTDLRIEGESFRDVVRRLTGVIEGGD